MPKSTALSVAWLSGVANMNRRKGGGFEGVLVIQ